MEELGFHCKGLYKGSKLHVTYHHSQLPTLVTHVTQAPRHSTYWTDFAGTLCTPGPGSPGALARLTFLRYFLLAVFPDSILKLG